MKTCRTKLAEYYKNSATVPTSIWSTLDPVDIHEIYTRLSCVKQEQNAAGPSQTELNHYCDLFTANKSGTFPKRILVQGQTGIGKTTFVKKLALDWAELNLDDETADDKKTVALKRFELLVAVNLKEVPKYQSLKDVIACSNVFGEEDKSVTDGLLEYITDNQNKVLLVFDGYDEYRCGRDSDIFKIFKGDKLRDCCVLITSRISKADDLRESRVLKLLRAEILGFARYCDISSYMKRKLGSHKDAETLLARLHEKNLLDLAKSPLLLLFFCILWKDIEEGHLESWPKTKTDLYEQIVQSILDHNQAKDSASCDFREVKDFKEILCEIGKVALDCLLDDDHVFDYNRLPPSISREESSFIGLIQLTKCIGRRRPAGMVSFMHKSIQEFLSAWYITYRWIIPEGNFGPAEKHARTFEGCVALENVLQFVCGLSDKGAAKVFKHLESIRTSDQSVDLTTTVPDVEKETDEPLSEVTKRHDSFYCLVRNSFREVKSKAVLSRNCFDCFGGVFLSTDPLSELLKLMDCNSFSFHFTARYSDCLELFKLLSETFESLKNETTEFPEICDFVKGFVDVECPIFQPDCDFSAILTYHCGRVHFYIRDLRLLCRNHATVFFKSGQVTKVSDSSSLFNFLTRVRLSDGLDNCFAEKYWEIVRNYGKRLNKIEICAESNWLVRILQEIPRPAEKCSLKIGSLGSQKMVESLAPTFVSRFKQLTSEGAEQLALLLPQFKSEISLFLNMGSCSSLAAETLVQSITHEQLQDLVFEELTMTSALAAALGQSLPKLTSLRMLKLGCVRNSITQVVDAKLLFGLSKLAHLEELYLSCFNMQENFITFIQSLQSSPNLMRLELLKLNLNGNDVCSLLESVSHHNPRLQGLGLEGNPLGDSVTSIIPYIKNLPSLSELWIDQKDCSEEGWRNLTEAYKAQRQFYIHGPSAMTFICK